MQVWRITRSAYPVLDGEGARLTGNRWNERGTPVVYTAAHLSLAVLELLVHIDLEDVLDDLLSFQIDIPNEIGVKEAPDLPADWKTDEGACRELGARWVEEGGTAVLSVPSAILEQERNYVLNPRHPDFARIEVGAQHLFRFDERLPGFRTA